MPCPGKRSCSGLAVGAFLAFFVAPVDGAIALTRGPYLQLGGPTILTVVWRTDVAASGIVEYGTTPALGSSVEDAAAPASTHVVSLSGLSPGTVYHYRVASDGQVLAEGLTFHTFPPPGSSTSFRLCAWADSGGGSQDQLNVAARLRELAPDLAIHAGDVIYEKGEAANFDPRYFSPYSGLISKVLVYTALGNHDVATLNGQPYLDAFYLPSNNPAATERYYSFDYGNTHFICLDTNQAFNAGSPQQNWFTEDLATMGGKWTVVFHHHSPYDVSDGNIGDPVIAATRNTLPPLCEKFGVDLVISAHGHCWERTYPLRDHAVRSAGQNPNYTDPGGTIYLTSGGGGRSLYNRNFQDSNNALVAAFQSQYHALALEFSGNTVTGTAVKPDGSPLDLFRLTKSPDAAPPVISSVAAVNVTDTSAGVVWETNELSDSKVEYGPSASLGSSVKSALRVTSHEVQVIGLSPGFLYHYRVHSKDREGNLATSAAGTFQTSGAPADAETAAYWRLEGNLLDSAPGARNGTASGSVDFTTDVPAAVVPQTDTQDIRSMSLNGSSHAIFPDPGLDLVDGSSSTLECFFRAQGPLADRVLFHEGDAAGDGFGPENEMHLHVTSSGSLRFLEVQGGAANVSLASPGGAVRPDTWHHAAVTLDGAAARLYLDGDLQASQGAYAPFDKTGWSSSFRVGRPAATGSAALGWLGQVDEVRVSRRPLSPLQFLRTRPVFRLDAIPSGVVWRSDPMSVQVFGTSTLAVLGFSARLTFDPDLIAFTGSQGSIFDGTVWQDSDRREVVVDSAAGVIGLDVVRDLGGGGPKPPVGPLDTALFAVLPFQARQCTEAVTVAFDDSSPQYNLFTVDSQQGVQKTAETFNGVTVIQPGETFLRGDVNGAAAIDPAAPTAAVTLADVIYLLAFLFQQGPVPPCLDAADVNADGRMNIVDPVFLLEHLLGNPSVASIPAPWLQIGRAPVPRFSCYVPPRSACAP